MRRWQLAFSGGSPALRANPCCCVCPLAEFVEVLTPSHVRMHVWERGAGRTLACGTGACATVVAGVLEGKTERKCQVGCSRFC